MTKGLKSPDEFFSRYFTASFCEEINFTPRPALKPTTGFAINGLGYIATGYNVGAVGTVWEYSPGTDTWEEVTGIEAAIRQDAISFSNGTRGLVLLGRTGNLYLDDNYELFPQEEYNEDD